MDQRDNLLDQTVNNFYLHIKYVKKSGFLNSTSQSYAKALYELANENSELDKVEDEMKKLNKLLYFYT